MSKPYFRLVSFASALLVPSMSLAQQSPQPDAPAEKLTPAPKVQKVEKITINASPLDVSTISPDHMVTNESLRAKQIEVLRGPASLLYGSGAIGGVVNVVSNLIPKRANPILAAMSSCALRRPTARKPAPRISPPVRATLPGM